MAEQKIDRSPHYSGTDLEEPDEQPKYTGKSADDLYLSRDDIKPPPKKTRK